MGNIAGNFWAGGQRGFFYNGDTFTIIDYPSSAHTYVYGINNNNKVVGVYTDTFHVDHAFIYDNGKYSEIESMDTGSDLNYIIIEDINDGDVIVGSYDNGSGRRCIMGTSPDTSFAAELIVDMDIEEEGFDRDQNIIPSELAGETRLVGKMNLTARGRSAVVVNQLALQMFPARLRLP